MSDGPLYATPRKVSDLGDCNFYHATDLPEHGPVEGLFDLRENIAKYFGGMNFEGKRVLEIGSASGFCSFYMESQGAEVVAYDLSEQDAWDVVPFATTDPEGVIANRQTGIRKIHNAFWLTHETLRSKVKVVYGSSYNVPEAIGPVDVAVFGAVLLHLRDPFLALQRALRLTKEAVVITEPISLRYFPFYLLSHFIKPSAAFFPDFKRRTPMDSWWFMPPKVMKRLIGVLGFEHTETTYHFQKHRGRRLAHYTLIGRRTRS